MKWDDVIGAVERRAKVAKRDDHKDAIEMEAAVYLLRKLRAAARALLAADVK